MNAFKQRFQNLSKGAKVFLVVAICIEITIAIGFAILGFAWNKPIVIIPIVIIIVSMALDTRRLMEAYNTDFKGRL